MQTNDLEPLSPEELEELTASTERIASKAAQNHPAAFDGDDIVRYAGLVARLIAMIIGAGAIAADELESEGEGDPGESLLLEPGINLSEGADELGGAGF